VQKTIFADKKDKDMKIEKGKIAKQIRKAVLEKVAKDLLILTASIKQGVENKTPVITGWTKANWDIIVDGKTFNNLPTKEILVNAKVIQIGHRSDYTRLLNKKYGIIRLTKYETEYLIRKLGYK